MPALEAAGVQEYYDVLYQHWEVPMKELHALRLERAKGLKQPPETVCIQIDDDDHDLEDLEKKSLEEAQKGIVVPGVIVIGDEVVDDTAFPEPKDTAFPEPSNPTPMEIERSEPSTEEAARKIAMIKQLN